MARRRRRALDPRLKWAIVLALGGALLLYAHGVYSKYSTRIGIIQITGEISSFEYADLAREALKDPRIKAVVLEINSPGGTVGDCFETEDQLSLLRKRKPVVASLGELGASGAYLVASASNYIFARSQTLTAGLGVIAVWVSYENKFAKEGIKYYVWRSGKAKDEFAPWRAPTPEENARIQELVDNIMDELIARILKNRVVERINELRDGRTLRGWEALGYRLVDEIGDRDDALRKAAELADLRRGEYLVVDLADPPSALGALAQSLF